MWGTTGPVVSQWDEVLYNHILLNHLLMAQTREVLPGVDLLLGDLVQGTG